MIVVKKVWVAKLFTAHWLCILVGDFSPSHFPSLPFPWCCPSLKLRWLVKTMSSFCNVAIPHDCGCDVSTEPCKQCMVSWLLLVTCSFSPLPLPLYIILNEVDYRIAESTQWLQNGTGQVQSLSCAHTYTLWKVRQPSKVILLISRSLVMCVSILGVKSPKKVMSNVERLFLLHFIELWSLGKRSKGVG